MKNIALLIFCFSIVLFGCSSQQIWPEDQPKEDASLYAVAEVGDQKIITVLYETDNRALDMLLIAYSPTGSMISYITESMNTYPPDGSFNEKYYVDQVNSSQILIYNTETSDFKRIPATDDVDGFSFYNNLLLMQRVFGWDEVIDLETGESAVQEIPFEVYTNADNEYRLLKDGQWFMLESNELIEQRSRPQSITLVEIKRRTIHYDENFKPLDRNQEIIATLTEYSELLEIPIHDRAPGTFERTIGSD